MRSKILVVVLVISLVLSLVGCGGLVTPVTDEAKVENVISEYFLAIENQDWNKAKDYCVYGSNRYLATVKIEQYVSSLAFFGVVIKCVFEISDILVNGSYSQAYIDLTLYFRVGGYQAVESGEAYYYLQKIDNDWLIYAP